MDVTDQFQQVSILFTQDGFVAVLEKMAVAMVAEVKGDSIPRNEAAHDRGQICAGGPEQKVCMVGNQRPGIARCLGLTQNSTEPIQKIVPVGIAKKDSLSAIPRPIT